MKEFFKTHRDKLLLGIIFISYVFILINLKEINGSVNKFLGLLEPFVYGFILAYLLNPLLKFIENTKIMSKIKKDKTRRNIGIALSYILLVSMLTIFFIFIIPDIWDSGKQIIKELPNFGTYVEDFINTHMPKNLPFMKEDIKLGEMLNDGMNKVIKFLTDNAGEYTSKAVDITKSVSSTIVDIVLGVIISLYMLIQKDTFKRQSKKILYALLKREQYDKVLDIAGKLNTKVSEFLSVKLLDSFILGVLCYIGNLIIGVDHALPIATLIGIGNIIPYFGSFIATIPCVIMVLAQSPFLAVIFLIFVLVLQWVDNNIISPKLMGDTMELNPFWVIFAVIIMTGLFGFAGIILGVPIFAVIYTLIREFIHNKLKEKGVPDEELRDDN